MQINLKGIQLKEKVLFDLVLNIKDSDEEDFISIEVKFIDSIIKVKEEYYFTCLQALRKKLFQKGVGICCYGAKTNVYPSPMMMNSFKAYLLTLGQQAKMEDVVDIFDFCELNENGTVEEQDLFYQKWLKSLK